MFPAKPCRKTTTLINQTGVSTRFYFGETKGNRASHLEFQIQPCEGILKPKEKKTIGVGYKFSELLPG